LLFPKGSLWDNSGNSKFTAPSRDSSGWLWFALNSGNSILRPGAHTGGYRLWLALNSGNSKFGEFP